MLPALVELARALRAAGQPPSPAEVHDAARALEVGGLDDRATVRLLLRTTLAKSPEARAVFEPLFEACFAAHWPAGEKRRKQRPGPSTEAARRPGREARGHSTSPSEPTRQRAEEPDPATRGELAEARATAERQRLAAVARARAASLRRAAEEPAHRPLRQRPDEATAAALEQAVERLGRQLRTRLGRRWRRADRERVDVRATVALAARHGGVPLRLLRRRRRRLKPRLVILCDVSGSVHRTAGFLLRLARHVARRFDRTEVLVFVDRPVPVGPSLAADSAAELRDQLTRLPGLDLEALSDFGHTFVKLLDERADLLTGRTSLVILGDARCNRFDPQTWALAEIAARVRRVVWLNPERRGRWYDGDSRLAEYEPYLTRLLPAGTLAELAAGLDEAGW